jgi:hypothetical protein
MRFVGSDKCSDMPMCQRDSKLRSILVGKEPGDYNDRGVQLRRILLRERELFSLAIVFSPKTSKRSTINPKGLPGAASTSQLHSTVACPVRSGWNGA